MKRAYNGPLKWKKMRAVLKSLSAGSSYFAACKAASITESTLWNWKKGVVNKRGVAFGVIVQKMWDRRVTMVEDAHFQAALKGSTRAQENILNNLARHRWRKDPDTVIQVGDNNSKHVTQIFQAAPQRIVFDEGEGDRKSVEAVPDGCSVVPPDDLGQRIDGPAEGVDQCQQENRLP